MPRAPRRVSPNVRSAAAVVFSLVTPQSFPTRRLCSGKFSDDPNERLLAVLLVPVTAPGFSVRSTFFVLFRDLSAATLLAALPSAAAEESCSRVTVVVKASFARVPPSPGLATRKATFRLGRAASSWYLEI